MLKNPFLGARWYAIGFASILTWAVAVALGAAASTVWEPTAWGIWALPFVLGGAAAASYARTGRRTWLDAADITVRAVGSFLIEVTIVVVIAGLISPGPSDSLSNTVVGAVGFGVILVVMGLYALPLALAGAFAAHLRAAQQSRSTLS